MTGDQLDLLNVSDEEMGTALAAIAAQREALAAEQRRRDTARAEALNDVEQAYADVEQDLDAADEAHRDAMAEKTAPAKPVWPHQVMTYQGHVFEVRKPDEAALIAVSMSSDPALGSQVQVAIFSKFLRSHMSPGSYVDMIMLMADSDAGLTIQGFIQALTQV